MDLTEVCPFLFIVSSSPEPNEYTEVSLDDFHTLFDDPSPNLVLSNELESLLESFPHKNYIPFTYISRALSFSSYPSYSILQNLICFKALTPIFNKSGLCFLFNKKSKLAKLSEILKENSYNMCGEIIKIASDVKMGKVGEDLTVSLTNGVEKTYKNTSENYLKTMTHKKSKKKPSVCVVSRPGACKVLQEISNLGN